MGLDPLVRFSSRAELYAKYRPSYPAGVVDVLARECGLHAGSAVADIGSGTGLLAKLFLDFGCEVTGVEPNAAMRQAGDRFLAGYERFRAIDGQAESTGLPDRSMDLVIAGQAFHWFDPTRARAEFLRILRPRASVALVWNQRRLSGDPFLEAYEALLRRYAPEYGEVDHRIGTPSLEAFFGHDDIRLRTFDNDQHLDLEGLRGRLLSSSYAPMDNPRMMRDLEDLFHATRQEDGRVVFAYETRLWYGRL